MFFLCTVECYNIIKPVFLHKYESYNMEIGKPDESLGRKATGPVKWQPVACGICLLKQTASGAQSVTSPSKIEGV